MHPDAVMLFAAGFGTRMGALTQSCPKPMIQVAGKPLIDHALGFVHEIHPRQIVVNLHYLPQMIRDHLTDQPIEFSEESNRILETGGGLKAALPLLGNGPVFTMNTDAVWKGPNPLALLQEAWKPAVMDALLLCIPRHRAIGHSGQGDFIPGPNGVLTRGPGHVFSGVQILKTDLLAGITEEVFSLNLLWDRMLQDERLYGVNYPGDWCDVGRPEGIALAEEMIGFQHV
ncbi:nucleotidyltransferase family protein [Thalassovita sp.]|uniref:nucleotidyltransferase family protein n=1 Tax=Thalassovita sp. TaxID=1979401 RepID=UPI0029DE6398|nr:nucleotidyltransferase family protein [Thalassovita sp.]